MIIIGYQGIGKSTLADEDMNYIDLESTCFWIDGERDENWYRPYCKIAEYLSKQGYRVFVSSHADVRRTLKEDDCGEQVVCCVPALHLKDLWIERLKTRYESDPMKSEKNYKAYMNAVDRYEDNVKEIAASGFPVVTLESMEYDLDEQIRRQYE